MLHKLSARDRKKTFLSKDANVIERRKCEFYKHDMLTTAKIVFLSVWMYNIYIYIQKERERERENIYLI